MIRALGLAALLTLPTAASAGAEAWPVRPVRLVVPYAPAGTTDIVARVVGQRLGQLLGQPVVIENRGGAGAMIGAELVARAPADGYTMMLCTVASHGISPSLYKRVLYDPVRDFTHVSLIGHAPSVLEVNPAFPARDLAAFVAYARAHPGIGFATSGAGSSNHIAGALFGQLAGIELVHVPYRGSGLAIGDLLVNHVPAMFDTLTSSAGHIKAGALRALATGGAERVATLPDVPTFIELGYQDMRFTSWFGLCTPAGLPAPILAQLNAALIESLRDATVRDRFTETSFTPQPMTPPQFTEFVRSETVRWAAMIKQVGATAE